MKQKLSIFYSTVYAFCLLLLLSTTSRASTSLIPDVDQQGIKQWESENFVDETQYRIINEANNEILEARAVGSASGLFYKKKLPINADTRLGWRWKVSTIWPGAIETSKAGDDFPVRIYIVVSDGPFFWQKRTLVYVWSNNTAIDTRWDNPFTSRAKMWAVDSGIDLIGQWTQHNRTIQADLKTAFGTTYSEIEAVAIMTDSDNGGASFLSWYDDIQLN
ncbi:DUF3047 domain-containing protein [Amphritea opalescens]|uniref:DUF3047 domain-containing protein n=1 Tax=Amphritea opalescens TaxID=2490544 RepID=A0A430KSE6_9GAMM|nr:DUF3047 domain-containing protein [Amphritea opalescens]RTE66445.1 DUF3047 domain-containing protein [Amphritea opalescens]